MRVLEAVRRAWAWCVKFLPEDRTNRYLVVTVLVSLLLHVLAGLALLLSGVLSNPVLAKRGAPLFVATQPDKPRETALLVSPQLPAPGSEPRVASVPQPVSPPPGMFRAPGGGGGLQGGRGGIEGQAIPLDTPEPRYQDYFNRIREKIKRNWIYPREAGDRGIEGELLIEFGIAKSGELQFILLRKTSGVPILDEYALRAVQLASPFPPVPDAISKGGLPINGIFRYQIVGASLLNNYLR